MASHPMGTEDESQSWYWADSDGVQSIVDDWELSSSLSTGTLPPYTLVWRPGWKEWIPACRVAELANLVPKESVEPAIDPVLDPAMEEPPPPPVDKYQGYRAREAAAKLLGRVARPTLPTPVPPPAGAIVPGSAIGAPRIPPRPPQPTLVDGTAASATATIRPPGAVPPPPRAIPVAAAPPPPPPPPAAAIPTAPVSPVIRVGDAPNAADAGPTSTEYPTSPQAAPPPAAPLPSWSDDVDAELARSQAAEPTAQQPPYGAVSPLAAAPLPSPSRRSPVILVIALLLAAVGGVIAVAVVVVVMRSRTEMPSAASSTPSASSALPRAPLRACRLTRPAARLAPSISVSNTPVIRPTSNGRLAIGFAADGRHAEGISVDPETLSVERPFKQEATGPISSVVPIATGGGLDFHVDVESTELRSPRSLDTRPRVTLGWTDAGFARSAEGAAPGTLWPGASEKVSDTRVVRLANDAGFAVTVRRGGKRSGTILVGRLSPAGERTSDPAEIDTGTQVGTPSVAVNDEGTLVAFASRPTDNAYWTLRLAVGRGENLPDRAETFATPPGGLGADTISPAAEGLTNGRWLLQWTEGSAGKRQVRVQTLGPDLVPVGDPLTLSPDDANAGQGVVMIRDGKGLSLFLVSKGRSHELWGASLSCP